MSWESMRRAWRRRKRPCFSSVACALVLVLLLHLALAIIPRLLSPHLSLIAMLPVSGAVMLVVLGIGRCCRRLVGLRSSAPASVLFNILFIWGVYMAVVGPAVKSLLNAVFHAECLLLLFGLYRILLIDPGFVIHADSSVFSSFEVTAVAENDSPLARVRHCSICKASIRGFDHHCPAFGNCIGQRNHLLFMILLIGFIIVEASYAMCSTHYIVELLDGNNAIPKSTFSENIAISTMMFCLLQMLWQVLYLFWHLYCISCNIRTEEWINWKKYPEFQVVAQPQPGDLHTEVRFTNPYDKGFVCNIREFFTF